MSFTKDLILWGLETYQDKSLLTPSEDLHLLFMDWLVCTGIGLKSPPTQSLVRSLESRLHQTTDHSSLSPVNKSLVLGFASHCKEMDDSEFTSETHPSAVLFSTIFSLAKDETPLEHALRCAWVGYQSLRPIGRAFNPQHYARGWHGTGTLGVYACTLSAGLLLNFNQSEIENAIGIAATLASGIQGSFGTQSKYLNSGRASSNAVLSVLLTQNSFSGATNIFDSKYGVFQMFDGKISQSNFSFNPETDRSLKWIKTKKYPGCHCLEPIINSVLSIALQIPEFKKIQKIRLYVSNYDFNIIGQRSPKTIEGVYFSASHMVALGLINKKIDFLSELLITTKEFLELESRVDLIIDKSLMPMECKLEIESQNHVYETKSTLIRDDSQNDRILLENKIHDLMSALSTKTINKDELTTLLKQKDVSLGHIRDFTSEKLKFNI